jgi:hypothetical protein
MQSSISSSNVPVKSNFFIAALLVGGLSAGGKYFVLPSAASDLHVELSPTEVDSRNPERAEFDRLKLLGAYELRSKDARFGGLSGLTIGTDQRLYAVSDRGFWLSARMLLDSNGRLTHLADWHIARLLTPEKTPVNGQLTDAEALAQAPDGSFVVAFEYVHRLWRYRAPPETLASPAAPVPTPSDVSKAHRNGGLEAVSVLPDGRIFTIAERLENPDGTLKAWLIGDGRFSTLSYHPEKNFSVSDSAALKNGDVIVLERRFSLPLSFAARLTLIKADQIRPGAALKGEELLRLEAPLRTDNFEGIAVMETEAGTMILLVSDDNYFWLQRTLLLQFILPKTGKQWIDSTPPD